MSFRPRAVLSALASLLALPIVLMAIALAAISLPAVASAEPMVIDCHTDTTFTPTLPKTLHDVQSTQPTSSDPSIVVVHLLRKGGGTDGSIELTAQGKDGSVAIQWAVKDTYTGEVQQLRLNVEVYCGQPGKGKTGGGGGVVGGGVVVNPVPPGGGSGQNGGTTPGGGGTTTSGPNKTYPRATHVTTSCAICHATVESLNEEIDAYNALIDKGAPAAQIEEMRSAMNATANALAACEKRCTTPTSQSLTTTPGGGAATQPVSGQVTAPTDKPSTPTTSGPEKTTPVRPLSSTVTGPPDKLSTPSSGGAAKTTLVQPVSGKVTAPIETPTTGSKPSTKATLVDPKLSSKPILTVPGATKPATSGCPAGQIAVTLGGKTTCKPKAAALVDGVG